MNRRTFLASLIAIPASASLAEGTGKVSPKKGWAGGNRELHRKFRVSWFYDWTANSSSAEGVEYVPMVKGKWATQPPHSDKLNQLANIHAVLGFNEPERKDQGNMTVDDAIATWPRMMELAKAKGLRLGCPAPSSDGGGMRWLEEFMQKARKAKLTMDFVALHWYRSRDAGAFARWLEEMHRAYRLPLWITEFNGWSGSQQENEAFLRGALKALEREKYVERYAYFNPGQESPLALLRADGSLTEMGQRYAEA